MKPLSIEVDGVAMTVTEICERFGLRRATVVSRFRKGLDVTAPVCGRNEKTCVVCGSSFFEPPTGKITCSSKCAKKRMSDSLSGHGMSSTRLHRIWCHMKARCSSTCKQSYAQYYSQRGIAVCEQWMDFTAFQLWAEANGYADDKEIDRIDNDKGYSPSNCRWATRVQQSQNKRKHKVSGMTSKFKGVSKTPRRWRAMICSNGKPRHLGVFDSEIEAAKAYDAAALAEYGEFACLNFKNAGGASS